MFRFRPALVLAALLLLIGCSSGPSASNRKATSFPRHDIPLAYPETQTVDQVDVYHGVEVQDPYRWLEDLESEETAAWVAAQNNVSDAYLERIPQREQIGERLTALWNYEKFGIPYRIGDRYFFKKNDGLQNQSVLYVQESLDEEPRVLLDPNTLSEDGTVSMNTWEVSEDGTLMVYGTSVGGSDWREFKVRNVDTGEDLEDHLKNIKFSGASWTHDGLGFYYSRFPVVTEGNDMAAANLNQKVYYHKIGTTQEEDVLVYERPDQPEMSVWGFVSEDGRYLILGDRPRRSRNSAYYYRDLQDPEGKTTPLFTDYDSQYSFVGNVDKKFYFRTILDAPLGRVIAIDLDNPARENWSEVIPESTEALRSVGILNHQWVASYLKDAYTQVRIHELDGTWVHNVEFPGIGTAWGFYGKQEDSETFYGFSNYTTPFTTYRYDMKTGKSELFKKPAIDFDPEGFEVRQVFYESKDGTKVPMFITHKKGLELDGRNPTYLYGYGGFNVSMTPGFSLSNLVWMEMGGVYAVACLRGGGEYGEPWHEAGTKLKKQNTFDDFIAAAEWLIGEGYTSSSKLAIAGGSNGGLLVGACMTQRPELFRACMPAVGVMDMLRYHTFTIGSAWISDYGSSENPEEFEMLYSYSPYHNLKPGTKYPATLVTTGDHDDRVVPSHSFKFAARLQACHAGSAPVLISIETKAGHGAGTPTAKRIEQIADRWAFLVKVLNMR